MSSAPGDQGREEEGDSGHKGWWVRRKVKPVTPAFRPWLHWPERDERGNAKHRTEFCSTYSPASHQARERRLPHKTPSAYLRRYPCWPFNSKVFRSPIVRR